VPYDRPVPSLRPPFTVVRADQALPARQAFARVVTPYLAKRETLNNLQLAILDRVAHGGYADVGVELLRAEDANGDVRAVVMRTPPHHLLVAAGDDAAARTALLVDLHARGAELPGVVGPLPDVDAVADWWASHHGLRVERTMDEGVYRLTAVTPRERAAGSMRAVTEADADLVLRWLAAFQDEALPGAPVTAESTWASFHGPGFRRLYLWETPEGEPVSLAGRSGRTPTGARIGPVYTPPPLRDRGYAEALVAALSRSLLEAGLRSCYLYTNLANAASNRVYLRVGFALVGEAAELRFVGSDGGGPVL
jgi:uncharacterized protein